MAFYIKSNDPEMNQSIYYSEDGGTIYSTSTSAKGYSTEAAAQAVIDSTEPLTLMHDFHWCHRLKQEGKTLRVVEE